MAEKLIRKSGWKKVAVLMLAMGVGACLVMAAPKKNGPKTATVPKVLGNEESWIIGDVARDLGQLVGFAAAKENGGNTSMPPTNVTLTPLTSGAGGRAYTVQVQPWNGTVFAQDFTVSGSPWEPGAYLPWAQSLAKAWGVNPQAAPAEAMTDDELVTLLEEPTLENVLKANGNLSAALTKTPGNAGLHEQAALLLMLLAWSEPTNVFTDERELLDSACAHLAMAETLRGGAPAGTAGQLAELTLLDQTGRQAEAKQELEALAATANLPQSTQDWVETLQMDNWGDWRKLSPKFDAPLLMCWEYYGWLEVNGCNKLAEQFMAEEMSMKKPNWQQTVFNWNFCNCYSEGDVKDQKLEIAKVMHALGLGPAPAEEPDEYTKPSLMNVLGLDMVHDHNDTPEAAATPDAGAAGNTTGAPDATGAQNTTAVPDTVADNTTLFLNRTHTGPWVGSGLAVISSGEWGAREQRGLMFLLETIHHLESGSKAAAVFDKQVAEPWAQELRLGPLLNVYLATNQAQYTAAMAGASALIVAHPEWVTAANWQECREGRPPWKYAPGIADYATWFSPLIPTGTTYDAYHRTILPELKNAKPEVFDPWIKLAPDDANIPLAQLNAETGGKPTPEALRAALGAAAEYSVPFGRLVADACKDDMAAYQKAMEPVCELNSSYYLMEGRVLLEHGMEEQAAAAYQKAVDHFDDNPWEVANEVDFLVNYYYDHGKQDAALKIAQQAADTHSMDGLLVLGRLDARMGNFTEAVKLAQESDQQVKGAAGGRLMIYNAWASQTSDEKVKRQADKLWGELFPKSKQVVTLEDFAKAGAPADGVELTDAGYHPLNAGMQKGDEIVAINGRRAHNLRDANLLLCLGISRDYQVIFWRDGQYYEKTVHLPSRQDGWQLGMSLKSFKTKGGA